MQANKIGLGFVGLRNVGKGHVAFAQRLPQASIVAYADTNEERLRDACAKYGSAQCYTDTQALLQDDRVDAVVLAVPNHLHAPMAIAALKANKHVLVEKPISRTAAEAREMIAARDQAGKVLMVGMNQRFRQEHRAVHSTIKSGLLGEIYYARTRWCGQRLGEGVWERGEWFLSAEKSGGGALIDLGVHRLDLALHMMGFPKVQTVDGITFSRIANQEAKRRGKGTFQVDEAGVALIRFTNGAALMLEASYFLNHPQRDSQYTLLCGTKGYAELSDQVTAFTVDEKECPVELPGVNGSDSCVEHFVKAIRGEEELSPTAEDGLVSMEILDALYESMRIGQAVSPSVTQKS